MATRYVALAEKDLERLEYEMIHTYTEPPHMFIGTWIILGLGLMKLMEMTPWLQNLIT